MDQFSFSSSMKTVLLSFMGLGILCLGLTYAFDDELHTRFWTNLLHNSVFFTGISFISLFILAAFITAWAGWYATIKRIWEAYSLFLIPGLVLMLIIIAGMWGENSLHHIYHWADAESVKNDPILQGKAGFLNKGWYTIGTIVIMGIWIFFAWKLRQLSLKEDESQGVDFEHHRKMRIYAAAFLPIAGFSSAAIIWQWIMSIDAHWYSTLFAWYCGASWFVSAMCLTTIVLIFMKSLGYFERVSPEHLRDLGKYTFAFSIFWTYLWFSQYMLIWYGNVGEETIYFRERLDNYPVLFFGNLVLNFVLPFFILIREDNIRKYGTMMFASIFVFIGHWLDFFLMIKPGALHTAHEIMGHGHHGAEHGGEAGHGAAEAGHGAAEAAGHAASSAFELGFMFPGLLEFGTMLGFLAFFLYLAFWNLSKAPLNAVNDPYYGESLQHHA